MTKRENILQAVKFTLFSASAGIIQFVSFTLLTELTGWRYIFCYLPSLVLSVAWNCTFNRKFTFKSAVDLKKAMLLALLFYVPFVPASTLWGNLLEKAGWNSYIIEILTMLINFELEFLWQKFFVFRTEKEKK